MSNEMASTFLQELSSWLALSVALNSNIISNRTQQQGEEVEQQELKVVPDFQKILRMCEIILDAKFSDFALFAGPGTAADSQMDIDQQPLSSLALIKRLDEVVSKHNEINKNLTKTMPLLEKILASTSSPSIGNSNANTNSTNSPTTTTNSKNKQWGDKISGATSSTTNSTNKTNQNFLEVLALYI